jgi:hypothetical protein
MNVDSDFPLYYYAFDMRKRNVLIVYESDSPLLKAAAQRIGKTASANASVKIRAARDVAIPDILLADAFFLGSENQPPAEYAEIERICKGINLAGRPCAFFSQNSAKAFDYLSFIMKDTDACISFERILFSINPDDGTLSSWVDSVLK